ncbi:uncharacterized protein DNG_07291 [Cephalotrichum gorgonifer]|uniref:Peptidase S8/S53 domain-containing protein n=1 Tax=Cephalotrichum gorgonifer TaxID=2041049 RepID=A0AAE8SX91_9PEZI|nr:uncharacterized protein DNG_07291 [Cephalotrichum gorgonifer]
MSLTIPKVASPEPGETDQFPKLLALSKYIESCGLGGFEECLQLPSQTRDECDRYLNIVGVDVSIFHKSERRSKEKRGKFLRRVKDARKHLLDLYCRDDSGGDTEELELPQHPSHGIKEHANRVYRLMELNWQCSCIQGPAVSRTRRKEARLSLIRYRQLALRLSSQETRSQSRRQTKFEVLLPACEDRTEWKVTNVEVKKTSSPTREGPGMMAVNRNICEFLSRNRGFQVDFLAEMDALWHLRPELREDSVDHYTTMESLHSLLGDTLRTSDLAISTPREKLTLCYMLASSMLFLYPGSWLRSSWSSADIYFARRVDRPASSTLTFPYLSVRLQEASNGSNPMEEHMQYHEHPALLALGIIFLEIATGERFTPSSGRDQTNSDGLQAWQKLKALDDPNASPHFRQIPKSLKTAIGFCLKLQPPSNLLSNALAEEGPIRQYILTRIVGPLAIDLRDRYNVRLEDLHEAIAPGKNTRRNGGNSSQWVLRTAQDQILSSIDEIGETTAALLETEAPTESQPVRGDLTFAERRELCLLADGAGGEVSVDDRKKEIAQEWLEYHHAALADIDRRRPGTRHERVKIAILDSGVELSHDLKGMYNSEADPRIIYKSWIDPDPDSETNPEWKDDVGHGTHLAVLLRKTAPEAIIHVARVFKKKPNAGKSAKLIAEALRYAVDTWEVDIIVMSFGFGTESIVLSEAIDHAAYKKVLMFAAASNDGKNRPGGVAWPASKTGVFCIHSADGYGNASSFTPSPRDNKRIMVLGECVKSAWPEKLKAAGDHKLMSGTSCAAPIAAGIAAVVLDYARDFLDQREWDRLRTYDSMLRMFDKLRDGDATTGYWWIRHWTLFDSDKDEYWIQGEVKGCIG